MKLAESVLYVTRSINEGNQVEAGTLKKGDKIVINGKEATVLDFSTSKYAPDGAKHLDDGILRITYSDGTNDKIPMGPYDAVEMASGMVGKAVGAAKNAVSGMFGKNKQNTPQQQTGGANNTPINVTPSVVYGNKNFVR